MTIVLKEAAQRKEEAQRHAVKMSGEERAATKGIVAKERTVIEARQTESFAEVAARKRTRLQALINAPDAEREAALKQGAAVAARYFATPEGESELADWRALQSEPFHE
jgi:hypothetical protein